LEEFYHNIDYEGFKIQDSYEGIDYMDIIAQYENVLNDTEGKFLNYTKKSALQI